MCSLRTRTGRISSQVSTVLRLTRVWRLVGTCHPWGAQSTSSFCVGWTTVKTIDFEWRPAPCVTFWDLLPGIRGATAPGHFSMQVLPVSHYPVWSRQDYLEYIKSLRNKHTSRTNGGSRGFFLFQTPTLQFLMKTLKSIQFLFQVWDTISHSCFLLPSLSTPPSHSVRNVSTILVMPRDTSAVPVFWMEQVKHRFKQKPAQQEYRFGFAWKNRFFFLPFGLLMKTTFPI